MFLTAVSGWIFSIGNISLAETTEPFDHSVCQYPYRLSNPENGCDNSDPACPLEIKGGSCENYQPTEKELEPWVPTEPATTTAPVYTEQPSPTSTTTCQN